MAEQESIIFEDELDELEVLESIEGEIDPDAEPYEDLNPVLKIELMTCLDCGEPFIVREVMAANPEDRVRADYLCTDCFIIYADKVNDRILPSEKKRGRPKKEGGTKSGRGKNKKRSVHN